MCSTVVRVLSILGGTGRGNPIQSLVSRHSSTVHAIIRAAPDPRIHVVDDLRRVTAVGARPTPQNLEPNRRRHMPSFAVDTAGCSIVARHVRASTRLLLLKTRQC